uniref:Uncharacterized protein n=1 Tax=Methanococcus maripaludis (strain C6 / ATCC BAA-1332) TaxID=444158 RepID=A9A7F0_METM6
MKNGDKEFLELLEKYSGYYSKMKTQMDYMESRQSQYIFVEGSRDKLIDMYPEMDFKNISDSDLRKIKQVWFREDIVEPLLDSFDEDTKKLLENIWVGHLPVPQLNARCRYVPNTKTPVIAFYDLLFGVLSFHAESHYIAHQLNEIDPKLCDFFVDYHYKVIIDIFNGKRRTIPCYNLPRHIKTSSSLLACAQEIFLLAHEYAHIYLNHLDTVSSFNPVDGSINIKEYCFSKQREFEADLQAIRWIINFRNRISNTDKENILMITKNISLVVELFFLFYAIELNCNITSETHPKSKERLQYIYENIKNELSEYEIMSFEQMFNCMELCCKFRDFEITEEMEEIVTVAVENLNYE